MTAGSPSPRQRARLIIPVWGRRYAARFTELTLPAILAPGNLPHLAASLMTEVVLVTQRDLFDELRNTESVRRLEKYCEVRLVAMDDLMSYPAYYGLTITWSLFRGFTDLGPAMTDTWLLFLNSDFILADGSYRSLVPRLLAADQRIVLAPSYCTVEEDVLPAIRARLDHLTQTLSIPPREMADLMLDRLHYTVRAKTFNRRMYRIERVDQFYYIVDNNTIVGRQFPIAIVAMKPERILTDPVAIWDYGTIVEACPTAPLSVIADSDEFLMLELRGRHVAADQLELGWLNPSTIARDLSLWTTADQRRCSEYTLILHSRDLPSNLDEGKAALAQFHRLVMSEVSDPLSHRDHPIWMRLQTLHHEWRAAGGDATKRVTHAWATQASESRPLGERLALAVRGVYRAIFGRIPYVRSGHPYWIDIHPTLALIERTVKDKTRAISVFSTPRAVMAPWVKEWFSEVREYRTEDVARDEPLPDEDRAEPVDFCFVELTREEMMKFRELHRKLRRMVRPGGHIVVLYRTHGVEVLAPRDVSFLVSALPDTDIAVVWYQGGSLTAWLQRQWDERLAGLRKRRRVGSVKFVMTALLGAPLTWLANRAAARRVGSGEVPRGCTSVLMDITIV